MKGEQRHGGQLIVEFFPCNDRQGHSIVLVSADGMRTVLLESIEGTSTDDWPPSPPLQSSTVEERPEGLVALLVGSAGGSHWSASVEMRTGSAQLMFDVACRQSGRPKWLGSQYRRLSEAARLVISSESDRVEVDDKLVIIKPTEHRASGTTRWRYAIALADRNPASAE